MNQRDKLKSTARRCHYDGLIVVKENGKRWINVLSYIEAKFDFNIDDYRNIDESWKKILDSINKLSDEEVSKLIHLYKEKVG